MTASLNIYYIIYDTLYTIIMLPYLFLFLFGIMFAQLILFANMNHTTEIIIIIIPKFTLKEYFRDKT